MDDLQHGARNKRGDWAPNRPLELAPFWTGMPKAAQVLGWIRGYLWPWNLLFMAIALFWWFVVLPDAEQLRTLSWGWGLRLLAANAVGIFLFIGAFEWRYYVKRVQERRFKYNHKFPSEQPSEVFWFRSQNLDNLLRSLFVSVPIGTAIEVLLLWGYANGAVTSWTWDAHPVYLAALVLLAPVVHELHFFVVHRAIHWRPLYKWVHAVHHNSVNPSPWSSLSMHPIEAAAYFGVMLWVLALPSHPFLVVWLFSVAGFGAVVGHIGFDRLELGERAAPRSHAYAHYLHHKFFEVNYCDNGVLPLDHWFGTWHDGSPDGERRMQERFRRKQARVNA